MSRPSPADLGAAAAETAPPLTDDQVEAAARALVAIDSPAATGPSVAGRGRGRHVA